MRAFVCSMLLAAGLLAQVPASLLAVTVTGNTGPGGLGKTNVSSNLIYWLEADTITSGAGNPVDNWVDTKTFSQKTFSQSGSLRPILNATGINGLPSVSFDGSNDKLVLSTSTTPASIITVLTVDTTQPGSCCIGLIGKNGGDEGIRRDIGSPYWRGTQLQTPSASVTTEFTYPVGSTMHVNGVDTHNAPQGLTHILSATRTTGTTYASTGLGDYFVTPGIRALKANVGEVIAFDTQLTNTQRVVVENYLSSKFAISIANDKYSGDASGLDYDLDVFGIGNDGTTSVLTSGSQGFGIEERNSSLGSNEWVLAGHKTATNAVLGDIEGILQGERWTRVWNVDANGGSVDARLAFDFDDASISSSFDSTDNFQLLYSSTSSFNWQVLSLTPTVDIAGKLVTFDANALANGFYTLSMNAELPAVPEPNTAILLSLGAFGLSVVRRRNLARA